MRIKEIISRYRNDFGWIGKCEHCEHEERYGDGYADEYYCLHVVPGRYCPQCGLNSHGNKAEPEQAARATGAA